MFDRQYRILGTGEVAVYVNIWWKFGYVEEILDNRVYATEDELNACLVKMQGLYEKLKEQKDAVLAAKQKVKSDRQMNPYHSEFFALAGKKDSKKFRKQRGKPTNLWESPRKAIMKARSFSYTESTVEDIDGISVEMLNVTQQPVGQPIRTNQNMSKAERQRQHQQNHPNQS